MVDTRHRVPWPACNRRPIRRNARGFGPRGGGSTPFDPSQIAGLEAWFRGDSYAGGTLIDKSGNGRNLTTVGTAPSQAIRAGQLAFSFNGTGYFQGAFGTTLVQPATIYAVWEASSVPAHTVLVDGDDSTNRQFLYIRSTDTTLRGGAPTELAGGAPSLGRIYASAFVVDSISSALYGLSDFGTPAGAGSAGASAVDGMTIGAMYGGTLGFHGYAWEVIRYSGAHDAATRAKFADYFNARYAGLQIAA